jgi:uncharacterized surface protein with fasciclin (FAS1) repeats
MRSTAWQMTVLAFVGALGIAVQAPVARAGDCGIEKLNLKQAAEKSGVLVQMMAATKLAGLDDPEVNVGPLTLFAPSDEAFAALPEELRDKLLAPENREQLTAVLLHHAVPGEFPTARLLNASARHYAVDAIDGTLVEITTRRGIDVAGAAIVKADIIATDGIIHIIDKVLIPKSVLAALESQPSPTNVAATAHDAE